MQIIYFDKIQNKEVVDVSGEKTPEQINEEFTGDFVDITDERNAKIETDKLRVEEEAKLKVKARQRAIDKLKILGLSEEEASAL